MNGTLAPSASSAAVARNWSTGRPNSPATLATCPSFIAAPCSLSMPLSIQAPGRLTRLGRGAWMVAKVHTTLVRTFVGTLVGFCVLLTGTALAGVSPASATGGGIPQVYWGVSVDPATETVASFEASVGGKQMSIIPLGDDWQDPTGWSVFPTAAMESIRQTGAIPLFTWQSTGNDPTQFKNAIITAGTYDSYIRQWATAAKAWGHPFFLRFDHEMDGWWYPWGQGRTSVGGPVVNGNKVGDFVPMWRHVYTIFQQVGATNVTWVWTVNHEGLTSQYPPLWAIYPGNAYVDWTGIDAFNWYEGAWLTFNQMLTGQGTVWSSNTYQKVLGIARCKPMMLPEFASIETWQTYPVTPSTTTRATPISAATRRAEQVRALAN